QVADQMPPDSKVGCLGDLLQRLLHLVFAEVDLARGRRGADQIGAEGFRNRDQPHRCRIASRASSRGGDPLANRAEPRSDVRAGPDGRTHRSAPTSVLRADARILYFFNWATSAFAVAEFGPSGASLR